MVKEDKNVLGSQVDVSISEPVGCFEAVFESHQGRRGRFCKSLQAKLNAPAFRKIEGFPFSEDDGISWLISVPSCKESSERQVQWYGMQTCRGHAVTSEHGGTAA